MSKAHPEWLIPIDDGSPPAKIEIRDQVVPPCPLLDLIEPKRLMTPMEAAQLGAALQDAAKYAAQLAPKKRGKR